MYHDRYSRRRAINSFHDHEEAQAGQQQTNDHWSWMLFLGVLLVQMTSRSIWASLGVISAFMLGDQGPSWLLLTTPTAFAVAWCLTEPWVKRLCQNMETTNDFMYVIMAGTSLGWLGAMLAAKSPIQNTYLVPLIGVVGGCGGNVTATASTCLVRKHFPTRTGSIRFYEQITASMAFFLMPVLSYYIMDTFGDHGGLLMHSGILMQGLVGGALLRGANWKDVESLERRPRAFAFIQDEGDPFIGSSESGSEEDVRWQGLSEVAQPSMSLHLESEEKCGKTWKSLNNQPRLAFGLAEAPDTPPEKRRKRKIFYHALPSITEDAEEEDPMAVSANEAEDPEKEIPPSPPTLLPSPSPTNIIRKPPRTFEHVFPTDRVLVTIEGAKRSVTQDSRPVTCDSETGEAHVQNTENGSQPRLPFWEFSLNKKKASGQRLWASLREQGRFTWAMVLNPLTAPAAFLLFASQGALLNFSSLTPVLLHEYIDDGTNMDGAYCVCVMGFTWLCFVIASPCFSTIHFTNHQAICVIAQCTSAFTLYMVTDSKTLDELVLYSSLFGLSHGVARVTSHSVLKMCFGSQQLDDLAIALSIIASVFHLLSLLLVSLWGWGGHLKNLYAVPSSILVLSAIFWTVQGCVSSVRANRGRHDFTWSRRRRVS